MVKLKNENVELKSKVVRLQTELSAARRNSARPLTARSIVGAAQNKDSATPRCSSTTSTTSTTAKTTLRPSVESATMAGSQARSTSGLGSRKGISKKWQVPPYINCSTYEWRGRGPRVWMLTREIINKSNRHVTVAGNARRVQFFELRNVLFTYSYLSSSLQVVSNLNFPPH